MSEAGTRKTSLVAPIILLVGFVLVLITGIFTVLIPELSDDEPAETLGAETATPDE